MFFKRLRNLQMMHIDFIDEDYDGALDEFDSSSSEDDSDNEGSANTGSGGGLFGFGRQRPEVQERYNEAPHTSPDRNETTPQAQTEKTHEAADCQAPIKSQMRHLALSQKETQ